MKSCTDCGAELMDQEATMCPACGKQLSDQHENERPSEETVKGDADRSSPDGKKKKGWCGKHLKRKRGQDKLPIPEIQGEAVEDGYDGYYDDVLPPDLDRIAEGPDRELIKNIILLIIAVVIVISGCITLLYVM